MLAGGILLSARFVHQLDASYIAAAAGFVDAGEPASAQLLAKFVRTTVAPGAYIIGASMYAAGRASKDEKLAELGLHGTEALVVGEMTGTAIKDFIGRARPYVNRQSRRLSAWPARLRRAATTISRFRRGIRWRPSPPRRR